MIMNGSCVKEMEPLQTEGRQTGEGLAGVQRTLLAGYWEWNLQTKKYRWCDEMYRIFNLTPGQFPLRTGTFFNGVHPEDREQVMRAFGKALVGEEPFNMEHRIVWLDGSVRYVHGKAEVTFDGGRPVRVVGTVQDITDKR